MAISTDHKKSITSVMNKHIKKSGNIFKDVNKPVDYEVVSFGSASIDDASGINGVARGKIYEIYGQNSSGKSSICYSICAQFQKAFPELCVGYIDPEQAVHLKYMSSFGVDLDPEKLLVANPEVAEHGLQLLQDLAETGAFSLLIYDSIPSAPTQAQVDKQFDENTMGELARLLSKSVNQIKNAAANTNTTVIFINQVRKNLGSYGSPDTTPGGNAVPFYASVRMLVKKKDLITDNNKEIIGQEIEVHFKKNKLGQPYQDTATKLFFNKGFDRVNELVTIGIKHKIIMQGGAWYNWMDKEGNVIKAQGSIKMVDHFKNNPNDLVILQEQILELKKDEPVIVVEADNEQDLSYDEE